MGQIKRNIIFATDVGFIIYFPAWYDAMMIMVFCVGLLEDVDGPSESYLER